MYEAWRDFLPGDLDDHVANIKSNKAFWKGKSELGQEVEMIPIPKFNSSVLRIRAGRSSSVKKDKENKGKRHTAKSTSGGSDGRRESFITKILRTFSSKSENESLSSGRRSKVRGSESADSISYPEVINEENTS